MDLFRKAQYCGNIGVGGLDCPCCNPFRKRGKSVRGKKDIRLNKMARKKIKKDSNKEFNEYLNAK